MRKKLFTMKAASVALSFCLAAQGVAYGAAADGAQGWQQDGSGWRYLNAEGQAVTGWIQTSTGWYYLNLEDGRLLTGWQLIDGCWYYLNTKDDGIEGQLRSGWLKDAAGNWYFLNTVHDGSFGKRLTGWHWIDGYCYYFDASEGENQGKMTAGAATPDGYLTDAQGRWAESDGTVHYEAGRGIPSEEVKAASGGGSSSGSGGSSGGGGSSSGSSSSGGSSNGGSSNSGNNNGGTGNTETDDSKTDTGVTDPDDPDTPGTEKPDTPETDGPNTPGTDDPDPEKPGTDITDPDDPDTGDEDEDLLFAERTKLVNLGWVQYAVVAFRNGTIDDYTVEVDGVDVTDACTKVDDAGTIVKWETTVWNPGKVSVTRGSDQKSQTVTLSYGNGPAVETAGDTESTPAAILTNGAVSYFDYFLDVYDEDGNVRTEPDYTTFDLTGERGEASSEVPADYYAPDTMITPDGEGELVVKFALDTKEREDWFGNLSKIKVLNQENNILNGNVPFEKSTDTTYGNTGIIQISLPQTNFYARGRYQLNFSSDYSGETLTIPVQLVDNRQYKMSLNELNTNPKPGECFAFDISGPDGETFGNEILSPIYRVDLGMPSGTVKTLTKIDDWYEIGDMLHICGTNTNGEVITDESGVYTVTVYANGYKTMSTPVEIGSAQAGVQASGVMTSLDAGIDAISGATGGSGGGSSDGESGGGGGSINAYLIFDHDLISNALILNEIGVANADAEAVVTLWGEQKAVSVMDESAEKVYDFVHYLNAVKDAKLQDGEYLTYLEYAQRYEDSASPNRPYQIKRVLEDGKLGSTTDFGDIIGADVPALSGTEGNYGDDLVLTAGEGSDYISKITALYLDGNGTALRSDDYLCEYEISEDKAALTIFSTTKGSAGGNCRLTAGKHTLEIVADGYKTAYIDLNVVEVLEDFELSLADPNPAADADAEDASAYYTGQAVYINAASGEDDDSQQNVRGDFIRKLNSVQLTLPDGSKKTVYEKNVGGMFDRDNYEVDGYSIVLQEGLFETAGDYTVEITAEGYLLKSLTFTVLEAAEKPEEPEDPDGKDVPETAEAELVEASYGPDYYQVGFSGLSEEDLDAYLRSESLSVTVNGEEYTRCIYSISWADEKQFAIANDPAFGGGYKYLQLTADAFTEGANTVEVTADGYKTFTFTIGEGAIEPEEKAVPETAEAELLTGIFGNEYYQISFEGLDEEALNEYLKQDLSITVNGESYSKNGSGSITFAGENEYVVANDSVYGGGYKYLQLTADGFTEDVNTVEIEADGYEPFSFTVKADGADDNIGSEDGDLKAAPEVAELRKVNDWFESYYQMSFEDLSGDSLTDYMEGAEVSVNGTVYTESSYWTSANVYKIANNDSAVATYLRFSTESFTEDENEIVISAEGYEDLIVICDKDGSILDSYDSAALELEDELEAEQPELNTAAAAGNSDPVDEDIPDEAVVPEEVVEADDDAEDDSDAAADDEISEDDTADEEASDEGSSDLTDEDDIIEDADENEDDNIDEDINEDINDEVDDDIVDEDDLTDDNDEDGKSKDADEVQPEEDDSEEDVSETDAFEKEASEKEVSLKEESDEESVEDEPAEAEDAEEAAEE